MIKLKKITDKEIKEARKENVDDVFINKNQHKETKKRLKEIKYNNKKLDEILL